MIEVLQTNRTNKRCRMHSTILPFAVPLPSDMPFAFSLTALATHLQVVPDRRKRRGRRYPLPVLLTLAVVAKLAGQSRLEPLAHWARLRATDLAGLFGLQRPTMPHQSTWSRVLGAAVDPDAVEQALHSFFQPPPTPAPRASIILAVDGKTLRGTIPLGHTQGVHLVAAYLPEQGVVLGQLAVDRKENEIVVVPTLLAQVDLQGVVVVGDAMQTQRALSAQVVDAGGDYVWFVKENQPTLLHEITELFRPPPITAGHAAPARDFTVDRQVDKGHGRLEERVLTASSMLAGYSDWPYLAQVFKLERTVWQQGVQTLHEIRYGITSVPRAVADGARLMEIARAEWGIENGLHYRRDVTLQEDACQLRRGGGPQVMAALNNAVVSLLGQTGEQNLAATQRVFAYQFERFLAHLNLPRPR
jgi:predicted transposase YbfD/YdcC